MIAKAKMHLAAGIDVQSLTEVRSEPGWPCGFLWFFDPFSKAPKLAMFVMGLRLACMAAGAAPNTFSYTTWATATASGSTTSSPGSAAGTLVIGSQTVNVTYTGDVAAVNDYPSLTEVGSGATFDYWNPASTFTNSTVANVPSNDSVIGLDENPGFTNTVTFSPPVVNPIMDILSLGNGGTTITYTFSATPVLLGQGPQSNFGGCSGCLVLNGNSLMGTEGDGVIEFVGTFSSISWTTSGTNDENGFTIGALGVAAVPSILAGGIVNAASYAQANGAGLPVAPGALVAIFTSQLNATAANFTTETLPSSLGGVSVTFNGISAPMVAVVPSGEYPYVSAQVPFEISPGTASVMISVNNTPSAPVQETIVASQPGIFTIPATGQGNAILTFTNPATNAPAIAAPPNSGITYPTAPIPRGTNGFFYVTGLGTMTPSVPDGSGSCPGSGGICNANAMPTVLVGGITAPVAFAGQAPGFPGVFQVNIMIPQNAPTGSSVSLVVKSADGSVTSNSATIAVQ